MYYFIGIKGSGMSALACVLYDLGYDVCGSDLSEHFFTETSLNDRNIRIFSFDENNIKDGMIIIKGNSFDSSNVEVARAMELGLSIYSYQEMVSKLTRMFKTITVAGCHGKTSTTAMLSHVLDGVFGCNYLIGDGTGHACKENKFFVLEACEYKRHFLEYHPYYAIITNIDFDHVDYFENIDDVIDAYRSYAMMASSMVIACGDDRYTHSLDVSKPIFYYGLDEDNDIIAKDVVYSKDGISFDVFVEDNYYGHFDLPIFGKHQLLNVLSVITVCYYERIAAKDVLKFFRNFKGAKRRFSETVVGSNIVVDDYAHHPTEIRATIKSAMQKYDDKDIVIVFQPHTFSRTKEFKDDYINILSGVSKAYIMDIHGSRESSGDISCFSLIDEIPNAEHISIDEYEKLMDFENTVILFLSPNDISKLENDYIDHKTAK